MTDSFLLDAAGRGRSPATMPGFHCGRPPRNKGLRYPADPPAVEEIVAVMRVAGDTMHGLRTRALIVVLWRAGLRVSEALALAETDLDRSRGSLRINFYTRMRSRWHAKACHSMSSSASSALPNLGITSVYLQGIDNSEIIEPVGARVAPTLPASADWR